MNIKKLQITPVPQAEKRLYSRYGHPEIEMIRGAGNLCKPKFMLIFMNPTARNVSSCPTWKGLRAPWIGTKKIWRMIADLGFIEERAIFSVCNLRSKEWTEEDALGLYAHLAKRRIYITNLASCTQPDARPLKDSVFRDYLSVIYSEIMSVQPQKIISFGNQVSSILLQRNVSVSNYLNDEFEILRIDERQFKVFPAYYPVGQGQRNMPKTVLRIMKISD